MHLYRMKYRGMLGGEERRMPIFPAICFEIERRTLELIAMARRLGFKALVVTVDSPVVGKREEDDRYKAEVEFEAGVLDMPRPADTNSPTEPPILRGVHSATLDWGDLAWIRKAWGGAGPVVLKGIQTADDAKRAAEIGVDGIYLSNHGGRQSGAAGFRGPNASDAQSSSSGGDSTLATGKVWKSALLIGAVAGVLIAGAFLAVLVKRARAARAVAAVAVRVVTTPPGASIRVNGEAKCNSDCSMPLPPGEYQVTAFLDGYQPSASNIKVAPGQVFSRQHQAGTAAADVRILTDLPQGQVIFDDQPPADLQDGQFVIITCSPENIP